MFQAASDSLQPDEYMEYSIAAIRHNKKMQEYTQTNQVDRIKFAVALGLGWLDILDKRS